MAADGSTKEEEAFLDEFADRYTQLDPEYKKIYDAGIPPPPIMYPWYGRPKLTGNRDRAGGSHRFGYREHRYENNYRDRDRDRDQYRENERDRRYDSRNRYRPY